MIYAKPKKEALAIHERAVSKYNTAFQKMEQLGNRLYDKRCNCVTLIREVEVLVSSIANRPKEFDKKISDIKAAREKFRETADYAAEALDAAVKSGASVAAGVTGGAAVASMAPTATMWIATYLWNCIYRNSDINTVRSSCDKSSLSLARRWSCSKRWFGNCWW